MPRRTKPKNATHDVLLHQAKPIVDQQRTRKPSSGPKELFHAFAHKTSIATGSPWAFLIALLVVVVWAVTGPIFKWSDTWQLVINTGTTIVTFLMVFLIQNTQNRDARAMHLKIDELISAIRPARNRLVDLEEASDDELDQVENEFKRLHERSNLHPRNGQQNERSEEPEEGKPRNGRTHRT